MFLLSQNIIRVSKLGERSKRVPQALSIEDMEVWFIHFVGLKNTQTWNPNLSTPCNSP